MNFIISLNIILISTLFFYGETKEFMEDMWIFYATHYVTLFVYIILFLKKECRNIYMAFSPILFSFLYLGISFTLGSIFIPFNYGWSKEVYNNFILVDNLNYFTMYFFIVDLLLLYYWTKTVRAKAKLIPQRKEVKWMPYNPALYFSFVALFLALNYVSFFQNILLGFVYPFKVVSIIYIVLLSFNFSPRLRLLVYFLITVVIFSFHFHSKREIILVVFIFLFLEAVYNQFKIKFKFKFVLLLTLIGFIGAYLILAASIMRGYGGYRFESKLDAFLTVPEYIGQPYFKDAFVENFEVNTVLGNTMICMGFVETGKLPLQYGGTYLKILFTPIPRSIWKNKPEGMILKYTYTLKEEYRKEGQSLPVVHYAEGFANFYWFGVIIVVAILLAFDRLFWYIVTLKDMHILNGKLIFSIYLMCILFQYIRGSGFDLFSLYAISPLPLILFINILPRKKIEN